MLHYFFMEKLILGLDISTSCIGFTITSFNDESNELVVEYINYVKFKTSKKYKDTDALFFKSQQFTENFIDKYGKLNIDEIIIEEPLISSNNAFSCHQLTKFNGMISQLMYNTFKIVPKYISSYDARKYAFPELIAVRKYDKEGNVRPFDKIKNDIVKNRTSLFGDFPLDCAKKEILLKLVSNSFKDIKWIYNSKNELKIENYDACDSLVCVLGYVNQLKYQNLTPKITDYSETEYQSHHSIEYTLDFGKQYKKNMVIINN